MKVNRANPTLPVIPEETTETCLQQDVTSTNPAILMFRELVRKEEPWYVQHNTTEKACFIKLVDTISTNTRPGDCINIADDFSLIVKKYSEDDRLVLSLNGKDQQFEIRPRQLYPLLMIDQITHPGDYGLTESEANALLTGGVLKGAELNNIDLSGVDLRGGDLTGAQLIRANLTGASLEGANLQGAALDSANLTRTNLAGASLDSVTLARADLTEAILTGTKIVLQPPILWSEFQLDYRLNHIHHGNRSLLMTIDSINNSYLPLKRQLLAQLIDSFNKKNPEEEMDSIEEFYFSREIDDQIALTPYLNNFLLFLKTEYVDKASADEKYRVDIETIADFMHKTVMPAVIQQANNGRWVSNYRHIYPVILSWIEPAVPHVFEYYCTRKNNLFFIQLIVNSQGHPDQRVRQQAHKLYEKYLQLPHIHPYTSKKLNAFGDLHGKVDWEDKTTSNIILISNDLGMLLSENQFIQMCEGAEKTAWEHFRLFRLDDPEEGPMEFRLDLNSTFRRFPLFAGNYQAALSRSALPKLLALLNLGEAYTTLFREELKRDKWSTENRHKLIEVEQQNKLSACMDPLLIQDDANTTLTDKHLNDIYEIYSHYSNNDTEKAQLLVSLAAVFVSFSSSVHFGTEADSPAALRQYAFALLHTAYQLDSSHTVITKGQFAEWRDKLLGLNNAFTCTAVLSDIIYGHATNRFPEVIHSIYPASWK